MEFCGLFQEEKTRMSIHHILDQRNKIFWNQIVPGGLGEEGDELGRVVVTTLSQSPPGLGQLDQADGLRLLPASRLEHRALPVQGIAAGLKIS